MSLLHTTISSPLFQLGREITAFWATPFGDTPCSPRRKLVIAMTRGIPTGRWYHVTRWRHPLQLQSVTPE